MHLVGPGKKPRKADPTPPSGPTTSSFPARSPSNCPLASIPFELQRGPEYLTRDGNFTIDTFCRGLEGITLQRFADLAAEGWYSGDLFVRRPVHDASF